MTCEHLRALERALIAAGIRETARGRVWTENCREWVYFDCILDLESLRARFALDPIVEDHCLTGCHEGSEQGFFCAGCLDGVMGLPPTLEGRRVFR